MMPEGVEHPESLAEPLPSQGGEGGLAPAPPTITVTGPVSLGPDAAPTDDTPTIISRAAFASPRAEGAFAQTLRGRRLAHYELIEPIGVGGMAAVIRARDTHLDRVVALKILPPEMAADPENIRRFQQEARAAARLDHENIARVFFCGDDQGLHFIAFEFVEGDNLRAALEKRGRLPVPEAVHYLLQLATGLAHAAERGVVHRDIKPSNIIITPAGKAKLVDMGLARSLHPLGADDLTQSGVTLGTFDYISPEQALEPREADVRSDIYSLGCAFYQLLTGQSPVPEGTAAKKLHHHQFVDPVDPRQLNPDVPDELAQVLACMMAKDPSHRYQHPLHLVKHLHLLAQQLGVEAEAPEAIRHLDVPLPHVPHPVRPALLAAAAAFLLVLLVVLHGVTSRPTSVAPLEKPSAKPDEASVKRGGPAGPVNPVALPAIPLDPSGPQPAEWVREVRSVDDLAEGLQVKAAKVRLTVVADELNLTPQKDGDGRGPGLAFDGGAGRELVIEGKGEGRQPRIKLTYNADFAGAAGEKAVWAALTIRGGDVTLRHLRFEVDATEAALVMAAVRLHGGRLRLQDCEFIQYSPAADGGRLSSVLVEAGRKGDTSLEAAHCYFAREYRSVGEEPAAGPFQGGQEAVTATGAARLHLDQCIFAPHRAFLHLREGAADVRLTNCTGFVVGGAAFELDEGAAGKADVRHSLFSAPEDKSVTAPDARAVLVRQSGRLPGAFRYEGKGNVYHNLTAYWDKKDAPAAATWNDFQRLDLVTAPGDVVLDASPWIPATPLRQLKLNQPQQAFQPNVQLRELRLGDDRLVGAERGPWGTIYENLTSLAPKRAEHRAVKIVDPSRKPEGGVYQSLEQALSYVEKGDVIRIRHNGVLPIPSLNLEKSALELTIEADAGYRPILTLGNSTETDVSLFRVYDGEVKFDGLEFLLKGRSPRDTQAVVGLAGVGKCEFERCTLTLDAEGSEAALAAVALADPSKVMAMPTDAPPREMPELRFRKCFVRGKGDLVAVRASRPFDLKAEQCLVALAGSFLNIEGTSEEPAAAASVVELKYVTTYLAGNLALLRANRKDLVNTRVQAAENCLFVSANSESLVHVEGNFGASRLKNLVGWEGRHNAYTGFAHLLDQPAQGEEKEMSATVDQEKWATTMRDPEAVFDKVQLAERLTAGIAWAKVLPEQFKLRPDTGGDTNYGVTLNQLPKPYTERPAAHAEDR